MAIKRALRGIRVARFPEISKRTSKQEQDFM